jgi:hypothetical protein
LVPARSQTTGVETERHTGTTWPEVERAADSTLIDRESGSAGTGIEATAESRLTADPNSARSDLESSAIFAGPDSDYGEIDRRLIRFAGWLAVVILLAANTKSAEPGIGRRDPAADQHARPNHAGACEQTHSRTSHYVLTLDENGCAPTINPAQFSHIHVNRY